MTNANLNARKSVRPKERDSLSLGPHSARRRRERKQTAHDHLRRRNERTSWTEPPALRAAMQADRAWFAAHPHATSYLRPVIIGEYVFEDVTFFTPSDALVLVTLLTPGIRSRELILPPREGLPSDRMLNVHPESGEVFPNLTGIQPGQPGTHPPTQTGNGLSATARVRTSGRVGHSDVARDGAREGAV